MDASVDKPSVDAEVPQVSGEVSVPSAEVDASVPSVDVKKPKKGVFGSLFGSGKGKMEVSCMYVTCLWFIHTHL